MCPVSAISGEKKELHLIDDDLCIECGTCGRICPHQSIQDQSGTLCTRIKRTLWEKPAFDWKKCMSCTICIDACPVNCLALTDVAQKNNPHAYPVFKNEKSCIGCGFCARECPVEAIFMTKPELHEDMKEAQDD
jgi:Na+-translocating ferredoxin:NAD+ oxidoreductase subunit B